MKYKLIASDFDDTILNSNFQYSSYLKETINKYIKSGGKFVIATGRMTDGIIGYCKDLGLKGEVVSYQGAVISDIESGKIIDENFIDKNDAIMIAKYIEENGFYFHTYRGNNFLVERCTAYTKMYSSLCNVKYKEIKMPISKYLKDNDISPLKMMIITDENKVMGLIDTLQKEFGDKFLFNTSKKWAVEIVSKNVNKGNAIKKICEKYGIKREETISIGDSLNDLPMIKFAELGVIVENGSVEAKKEADIIAPSNDNEGVAYIINKYGFLE